jgi:hypothetical protein
VRVEARLNRPAYMYMLWIEPTGQASPVYPWKAGDWTSRPTDEMPTERISLPRPMDAAWPIAGGPGMETLILLVRETPLPEDIDLRDVLNELPPQSLQHPQAIVEFENGAIITAKQDRDRGPKFFDTGRIDDPIRQTAKLIQQSLSHHFTIIRSVSFANQGE